MDGEIKKSDSESKIPLSNEFPIAVPQSLLDGHDSEAAMSEKELISASNSSKKVKIMSTKLQAKPKTVRKVPTKKKTTVAASSKSKNQSKSKFKDETRASHSDGSSGDDKFLEEFASDGSDFSSSTESDDISQEFSDEDRLMEYYEKKLREHSIVGNFGYKSDDSEDSEPSQELKRLVEDTFKPKPSGKRGQTNVSGTSFLTEKKAAKVIKREQAKLINPSGNLKLTKSITSAQPSKAVKVGMKSVISSLKSDTGIKNNTKGDGWRNGQAPKLSDLAGRKPIKKANDTPGRQEDRAIRAPPKPARNFLKALDLTKPGSKAPAASAASSTPQNFGGAAETKKASEDPGSYQKVVDYLTRIKEVFEKFSAQQPFAVFQKYFPTTQSNILFTGSFFKQQHSISEITRRINADNTEHAPDSEILKSTRTTLLEQRDRSKKSNHVPHKSKEGPTSASDRSVASEKHLKDEVVDWILNATLGVS